MSNSSSNSFPADLSCEAVDELLPAYVLGALDADELDAVARHIQAGREHDDALIQLRATTLALGTLTEDRAPTAELAARVAGIAARPAGSAPAGEPADAPARGRSTLPGAFRASRRLLLAAALIVAGVFVATIVLSGALQTSNDQYTRTLQGSDDATVVLSGVVGIEPVEVVMSGLARLPAGSAYQLWAIRDGRWQTIGVCNTNAQGGWTGDFPFALLEHDDVALTIEPAGGSTRPTSDPILSAEF